MFLQKEIFSGVFHYGFCSRKFKFNVITINFILELQEKTASKNAVLCSLLRESCKKYSNNFKLGEKLRSLYGANLFCDVKKAGNKQIVMLGVKILDDEFALEGEKLKKEAVELLMQVIFNPKIENEQFSKKNVELEKNEIKNLLKNIYNDKKQYALSQAVKTLFEGKAMAVNRFGTLKELEKINEKNLVESYESLILNSKILVCSCTREENFEFLNVLFNRLKAIRSKAFEIKPYEKFYFEKFKEKVEQDEVLQAKLVLAFAKNEEDLNLKLEDELKIEVMNCLFGGSVTSLLFNNVREKLSLCYYCRSYYNYFSGVIFVESGVESKNIEKAYENIILQLEALKKGDFSEEELNQVKCVLEAAYESVVDGEEKVCGFMLNNFLKNRDFSVERIIEIINSVKKEDIINAAKMFNVALKYVLKEREN